MEIELHRNFLKNFKKFNVKIRIKFLEKRNIFLNNPFDPILNNHPLNGEYDNCRSINITGDIRVIYKREKSKYIFIAIGSHSELY